MYSTLLTLAGLRAKAIRAEARAESLTLSPSLLMTFLDEVEHQLPPGRAVDAALLRTARGDRTHVMWCVVVPCNSGGWDIDIPDVYGPFETRALAQVARDRLRRGYVLEMKGRK